MRGNCKLHESERFLWFLLRYTLQQQCEWGNTTLAEMFIVIYRTRTQVFHKLDWNKAGLGPKLYAWVKNNDLYILLHCKTLPRYAYHYHYHYHYHRKTHITCIWNRCIRLKTVDIFKIQATVDLFLWQTGNELTWCQCWN